MLGIFDVVMICFMRSHLIRVFFMFFSSAYSIRQLKNKGGVEHCFSCIDTVDIFIKFECVFCSRIRESDFLSELWSECQSFCA